MTPARLSLLFPCVLAACGGGDSTGPAPGNTNTPGTVSHTVTIGGQARQFVVHVGDSVGRHEAVPVVFMFHGSSQNGPQFYNISGWREQADTNGFIAVFPSALTYCYHEDGNNDGDFLDAGETTVGSKWTHGELNTTAMPLCTPTEVAALTPGEQAAVNHAFQEDVPFVDSMLAVLRRDYLVDSTRIYGSGFSNGSAFAARLVADRNQVFAALSGHPGGLNVPAAPGRAISFSASLGAMDPHWTVPLAIATLPVGPTLFTDYPGVKAKYVTPMLAQLELADAPVYDEFFLSGKKVARWTYTTSLVGASNTFVFSLLEDNDHSYPNGVGHPIVLARPLWAFFQTQVLP